MPDEDLQRPGLLRRNPVWTAAGALGLLGIVGHVVLGPGVVPAPVAAAGLALLLVAGLGLWLSERHR
jgi:hypothetical protein